MARVSLQAVCQPARTARPRNQIRAVSSPEQAISTVRSLEEASPGRLTRYDSARPDLLWRRGIGGFIQVFGSQKAQTRSLFFALGFFSLLTQTLIVREFIVSFGGSEFGIGLFYFSWLLWVGIGALATMSVLGKFLYRHFVRLLALYPLLALAALVGFVVLKRLSNVAWWEFFSFGRVIVQLLLLNAPVSVGTGVLFTLGIQRMRCADEADLTHVISISYSLEALGSFASGIIVTLLISRFVHPLIVLPIGTIVFATVALSCSIGSRDNLGIAFNVVPLAFGCLVLLAPDSAVGIFQRLRMNSLLPKATLIVERYTPYQHLVIADLPTQRVVLSNGSILGSYPEVVDADRDSALIVSQALLPKKVLVLGAGAENLIASLLKYPVEAITYCVQDKAYYASLQQALPSDLRRTLLDPRLRVVFDAPRSFVSDLASSRQLADRYDLVVIHTTDPSNLVVNALFTREFYALVESALQTRGVLATRISAAENYIGEEISNYGSSLFHTLRAVFDRIVVVPGTVNWFFAGGKNSPLTEDAAREAVS